MNPIPTAHVLLFHNGKVLIVKHAEAAGHLNGVYGIPGGRLNPGETLEDAAVRELQEETGLIVQKQNLRTYPNNSYTADIIRKNSQMEKFTMTVFVAEKFTGEMKAAPETHPVWVDVDRLYLYNLLPNVEKAVNEAFNILA